MYIFIFIYYIKIISSFRIFLKIKKKKNVVSSFRPERHFYLIVYFYLFIYFLLFLGSFRSNPFVTFEECKWTKENTNRDILDTLVSHLIKSCVICKSEGLGWELHCVLTTERLQPVFLKAICFRLNTFLDELSITQRHHFPPERFFFIFICNFFFLQYILQFCSGQINLPGDPLLHISPKHVYYISFFFLHAATFSTQFSFSFFFFIIYKKWQSIQTCSIFKSNIALMDLFPSSCFSI